MLFNCVKGKNGEIWVQPGLLPRQYNVRMKPYYVIVSIMNSTYDSVSIQYSVNYSDEFLGVYIDNTTYLEMHTSSSEPKRLRLVLGL